MAVCRQQLMGAIARAIEHLRAQGRTTAPVREILAALEELGIASTLQLTESHLNALGDAAGKAGLGLERQGRKGYSIPTVSPNAPPSVAKAAPPELGLATAEADGPTKAKPAASKPADAEAVALEFVEQVPPELQAAWDDLQGI